MRYRLTPFPGIAVYCSVTPGLQAVEFLGVALLDAGGSEDVRNVTLQDADDAATWLASLPVDALRQACAA